MFGVSKRIAKEGNLAEGMGFEPMGAISHPKRLAGARTRPLCDPSGTPHYIKAIMLRQA